MEHQTQGVLTKSFQRSPRNHTDLSLHFARLRVQRFQWTQSKSMALGTKDHQLAHSKYAININAFYLHPFSSNVVYAAIKKKIMYMLFYYVSYVRA